MKGSYLFMSRRLKNITSFFMSATLKRFKRKINIVITKSSGYPLLPYRQPPYMDPPFYDFSKISTPPINIGGGEVTLCKHFLQIVCKQGNYLQFTRLF